MKDSQRTNHSVMPGARCRFAFLLSAIVLLPMLIANGQAFAASMFATNAGGPAYTAADGTVYQPDAYYSAGATYSTLAAITGTPDPTLYQTERYGGYFFYNVDVPNGNYSVTFKFAEIYWNEAGHRIFNVSVQGLPVISGLDIFAKVGGNAAYDVTVPVSVTNGTLNITFTALVDYAIVSAINVTGLPEVCHSDVIYGCYSKFTGMLRIVCDPGTCDAKLEVPISWNQVGPQGLQGLKGDTGSTGATGLKGDTGLQGLQGVTGPKGDAGPQGLQGQKGDTGLTGLTGPMGPAGIADIEALNGTPCTAANGANSTLVIISAPDGTVTMKCPVPGSKVVFLSSIGYTGNLGGLSGADSKCQLLADAVGITGVFKAWLSDSEGSPSTRFSHSPDNYVRVDGAIVAAGWIGLTSGTLQNPINVDEKGNSYPLTEPVWTNTLTSGERTFVPRSDLDMECSGWTYGEAPTTPGQFVMGFTGNCVLADKNWTDWRATYYCNGGPNDPGPIHLYCFQQ